MILYQDENSTSVRDVDRRFYNDFEFLPNIHAHPEFIYVLEGELEVTIDGGRAAVPAGRFCIVLPWQVHAFATKEHSRSVVLVVSERYVSSFTRSMTAFHGETQAFEAEPELRALFERYLCGADLPDEYMLSSILLGLCHCFVSRCRIMPNEDRKKTDVLQQVMQYISAHDEETLTLKDVADAMGYSYYYLSHLFSRYAGVSFRRFCNVRRLQRAQRLLECGDAAVTDVAFECGFSTVRSFNRVFREIVHMTPGEYRAACSGRLERTEGS